MIGFGVRQLECRKATHDMEGGLHFQTFLVFKCHVPDLWFETTDFKNEQNSGKRLITAYYQNIWQLNYRGHRAYNYCPLL